MLEFETVKGADSKDKDIDQYRALPTFYGWVRKFIVIVFLECDSQQDVRADQQRS